MRSRLLATAALASAALALAGAAGPAAAQEDTIKVGVLHSLSGTMAISETTLKDVMLMLIEEQNKKGGLLGKKLEPVVVDPASNWPLFAEKARELITKDKVAATFGCWTSVSRKSVLPVFEELNSILFYPVQYEGEESSRNVFYTGAAPNQQAIPAVDYLMAEEGVERWVLAGTDYVYPRTTNKILEAYLKQKGVAAEDIMINYTPFGHSDWQTIVSDIKKFGTAGKKTAVVSTINGDANVPFYKELGNQGVKATDIPVVAFSVGEEELAGLDTTPLVGHLAAWNYFMSVDTPENQDFIGKWHAFIKDEKRVTNDPMEAHVIGFNMWVKAVEKAGTTDPDADDRVDRRRRGAEPVGRLLGHDAEPPHHQARADRRDPGRRPVQHRLGDPGPRRGRRVVRLPRRLQGSDRRLAGPDAVRELQRPDRQVRRPGQLGAPRRAA
jgi:urea transport system substrate-binding protein